MLSPLMDTFLIVARYLSFTRAAQELYTTQPTISRQITALEEEWGFPLFARSNKEVALTEEGALMLDACKKSADLLSASLARARELHRTQAGSLRIGMLSSVDERRTLLPALSYFDEIHPNIQVTVEKGSYSRLREGLESGEFDVIFTLDFEVVQLKDVSVKCIEELPCCFLLSPKSTPCFPSRICPWLICGTSGLCCRPRMTPPGGRRIWRPFSICWAFPAMRSSTPPMWIR